jgi:hypothetical protein
MIEDEIFNKLKELYIFYFISYSPSQRALYLFEKNFNYFKYLVY